MSPKIKICKEPGCMSEQTAQGFCRLHYLKCWKNLRAEKRKKSLKSLNKYVDNIIKSSPDRYVDTLKENIRRPVDFETGFRDDFDVIVDELEYKQDLDELLNQIKVDKAF